jgi:protein TonB
MSSLFSRPVLLALLFCVAPVWAQQTEKLSDAERAKRDADKVFSFIKFHTVKPAAAAAAAPRPTPPAPVRTAVVPAATAAATSAAAAPVARAISPSAASSSAPQLAQTPSSPPAQARGLGEAASTANATPQPAAALSTESAPAGSLPPSATPQPPATQPEPALAPAEEEEEVPLKLIAYTPPDMSAQVMAAMDKPKVVIPVRFTVQADGRVSAAKAMGNAPRRIENSAVRAVMQWRFEPLPAVREVDVEIAFNAAE